MHDTIDTAVAANKFKILAALVAAAGSEDRLKSDGPFTVPAPSGKAVGLDHVIDAVPLSLA